MVIRTRKTPATAPKAAIQCSVHSHRVLYIPVFRSAVHVVIAPRGVVLPLDAMNQFSAPLNAVTVVAAVSGSVARPCLAFWTEIIEDLEALRLSSPRAGLCMASVPNHLKHAFARLVAAWPLCSVAASKNNGSVLTHCCWGCYLALTNGADSPGCFLDEWRVEREEGRRRGSRALVKVRERAVSMLVKERRLTGENRGFCKLLLLSRRIAGVTPIASMLLLSILYSMTALAIPLAIVSHLAAPCDTLCLCRPRASKREWWYIPA